MVDENQILLILDIVADNPVCTATLEQFLPPSQQRRVYRLSEFGAVPAASGSTSRHWRSWMIAVDKMLARARQPDSPSAVEPHYYVAGRAFLPVAVHLGMRLSKWAHVTCINQRRVNEWDVLPLDGASRGPGAFFTKVHGLQAEQRDQPRGKLAVFVGTGRDPGDQVFEEFVRSQHGELAGLVRIQATGLAHQPIVWLTADNVLQARAQLEQLFVSAHNAYPDHDGLVLFIAGPLPLALLAGMFMNPQCFKPIWFPNFDGARYQRAIEFPWGRGRVLQLCYAAANPIDTDRLNLRAELDAVRAEIASSGNLPEFAFEVIYDANIDDIRRAMMNQRPQVLHISGHANHDTLAFVREHDGCAQLVPARAFVDLLEATNNDSFLELVVLNSCKSAAQAQALTAHVDCAIGMSDAIDDRAARDFARALYGALARGRTVKNAYDQARALLAAKYTAQGLDAGKLVELYTRDGVDANEIVLVDVPRRA